jgi:hypothetical protein
LSYDDDEEFAADDRAEEGLARLVAVERLGAHLASVPWFTHVGQPLLPAERGHARDYLDALGFADADLVPIRDWEEAASAAENPGFDSAWWDAEEQLRAALTAEALTLVDDRELNLALTRLSERAGAAAGRAAKEAAELGHMEDESLLHAAVGAAVQAAHQRALVEIAGADADHAFRPKFALFESGRWPIAVVGSTFHLF